MSSTCFLRSAISASRIASWNWLWNSDAMRRSLFIHCPSVRSTPGSSFGPIAISATRPMINGLGVGLGRFGLGFFLFRQPLLERFDALGKIAHQLGDLAASAE